MKIECTLQRKNGSTVNLENDDGSIETYSFQPDDKGNHVCMVANKSHQDIFLAHDMNGAFIVHGKVAAAQVKAANAKKAAEAAKEASKEATAAAKKAEAEADKALADAEAEEKRLADEVAVEEQRENERAETIAKAKLKLEDERKDQRDAEELVQFMKDHPDMNEEEAKKALATQKATDKVDSKK